MEVRLFPNSRRPGVGLTPRREATRPLLPQHARHCPVLEAGSALGFMVYAPLEPKESLYVEYEGDGRYKFVYYLQTQDGQTDAALPVTMSLSRGRRRHDEGGGRRSSASRCCRARPRWRRARLSRPRGHGHAAGRHRAARRHELPDAVGLGHGLHADLQHDRAPGRADARRPRRNRLVRARDRIPLRAAARARASRSSTACRSARSSSPREEITMRNCTNDGAGGDSRSRRRSSTSTRPPPRRRPPTASPTARTTSAEPRAEARRPAEITHNAEDALSTSSGIVAVAGRCDSFYPRRVTRTLR